MSNPRAAAERFLLAYVTAGEEHLGSRPSDDIFELAAADLIELNEQGPGPAFVAMLHVLDVAIDLAAHLGDTDRVTIVRAIVTEAENRRAPT